MAASSRKLGLFTIVMVAVAQPAWAHHVMGGKMPETFMQGLLSGFGHPVIGVDHLAAIVGVGVLAALAGRSAAVVLAFSVAVIAGVGLHLARLDLPASELLVGLTTLLIGALVVLRQSMSAGRALLLFAIAGLVHGYALGESIVGAEPSPLMAYLLGLLVIQTAIGVAVHAVVLGLARWPARATGLTVVGALVVLAGGIARGIGNRPRRVTTTILYVCVTCRGDAILASDVSEAVRPGARLLAAVEQRLAADGDRGIAVVPANCLSNCPRGCSAAVSASGKWTYVIGDLDPDRHAGDIVDFARLHRAHEQGVPEWRDRPEHVRKHTIARVPPVKPAAPSQEQS